jgi:hypothetical protein
MEAHRRFSFYSPQDFKHKESIMKTKHGILFSFVALLLVTMFTFSACDTDGDEDDTPALAGTTWANGTGSSSSLTFKYVDASKWEKYQGTGRTTDLTNGAGTYTVSGTTISMGMTTSIGFQLMYTGEFNKVSSPPAIKVTDSSSGTSSVFIKE